MLMKSDQNTDEVGGVRDDNAGWYVAGYQGRTPSGHDQERLEEMGVSDAPPWAMAAMLDLMRLGVGVFLPTVTVERRVAGERRKYTCTGRSGGRRIRQTVPLFPGYLFVRPGADEMLSAVIDAEYVASVLTGASDAPYAVPAPVMTLIFAVHGTDQVDDIARPWLAWEAGDAVRIEAGALQGYNGFFKRNESDDRMEVEVSEGDGPVHTLSLPSDIVALR